MNKKTIVFFDSDCLMCQGSVKWLNRLDANDRLFFAPFDGRTAQENGLASADDSMGLLLNGEIYRSSEAARLAFWEAGGVGMVVAVFLKVIPLSLRECGYRWIARHRKALVTAVSCGVPEEGLREKRLD